MPDAAESSQYVVYCGTCVGGGGCIGIVANCDFGEIRVWGAKCVLIIVGYRDSEVKVEKLYYRLYRI